MMVSQSRHFEGVLTFRNLWVVAALDMGIFRGGVVGEVGAAAAAAAAAAEEAAWTEIGSCTWSGMDLAVPLPDR